MKHKFWSTWVLLLALLAMIAAGGCGGGGGDGGGNGYNPSPTGRAVRVSPTSLSLGVGQVETLYAANYVGTLTWWSENESVARVASANSPEAQVTAVAVGTTTIYVRDMLNNTVATCALTVTGGGTPGPTTLTVTPATLSLAVGSNGTLTAQNYTGELTWTSDKTNIAWVAKNGTATAAVTAVAVGTAKISVRDGSNATAESAVTVTETETDIDFYTNPFPRTEEDIAEHFKAAVDLKFDELTLSDGTYVKDYIDNHLSKSQKVFTKSSAEGTLNEFICRPETPHSGGWTA
jgi:hypothetical protein